MPFEIIHKPTFTNQLLAIPKERVVQILEKIEVLRDDPKPHGSLKKKLHGYKGDIYRLRSGDFRIIYTYGDGWVALLGVDARKDVYKGDKLIAEETEVDVTPFSKLDDLLTPEKTSAPPPKPSQTENLLPVELTEDLLDRLLIPKACFPTLLACRTFDDLLEADVPDGVRDRLFDCITAPNFDQVLSQPSFVTGSPDELLRFKEGDLLGFLLKLNPEQEKFVTWAVNATGPTLLKGSPGTGKSTVALYRTREILKQLQANGTHQPRILFTTYTNALVTFSEQLLQQLLGQEAQFVEVKTADALMSSLVRQSTGQPKIGTTKELLKLIQQAVPKTIATLEGNVLQQQAQRLILQRLQPEYLLEEMTEVIDARGIETLEEYQATPRTGRSIPLNKTQRQAIWKLRHYFNELLAAQGIETWAQMRNRALALLQSMSQPPLYDAVIIDEAQDLSPTILRFLIQLCPEPNRFFITADANQSIYGSSFRWSDVHESLKFVGRTGILKVNHRTTQEIGEAAYSYLQEGTLDEDDRDRLYIHTGPPPAVRAVTDRNSEGNLLAQFCRTAAHEFRLRLGACAILVPTEKVGKNITGQLNYLGIEAQFMTSKDLDLNSKGVKVLPLKAAKGLEFPIVAIAGFLEGAYPTIPKGTAPEAATEILNRERRTLYVAMTRAMRALLVLVPAKKPSPLLQTFDPHLWNLGNS
ncbi:UvrD-helicase domain-containing protein [Oscillatoria sp. FACHB-1407]|uniref:UvrD-helicase domain-containing protein n=1 Tax=Oscillatoria sp. FACHB-1407 TaxID=2692847 RepID=UPI001686BAFC|nr:UvrD-helicase domain-containing protein [Oscillatoria sp. FACHB-1407]MBD2463394.1 UvrD-helicase domain-containing protein [Oscillatoria sp. FACHB-1407]